MKLVVGALSLAVVSLVGPVVPGASAHAVAPQFAKRAASADRVGDALAAAVTTVSDAAAQAKDGKLAVNIPNICKNGGRLTRPEGSCDPAKSLGRLSSAECAAAGGSRYWCEYGSGTGNCFDDVKYLANVNGGECFA